jgi:hypothetical protein
LAATTFNAGASAAGFFYQSRLALLLCMEYVNRDSGVEVAVERLDDVSFERHGSAIDLLRTKHHIDRVADLTDYSADIWKTIRVWAEVVAADPSLPSRARLALVTTGTAPPASVAALLLPASAYAADGKRNPKLASERLTQIAETSTNQELKKAFAAYLNLSERMRASLLSAVEILDRQPLVTDVDALLEDALRMLAPRGKAHLAREMLEGWWWPVVCRAIIQSPAQPIAIADIENKLDEIREMLKRDSLTADFEEAEPSAAELAGYDAFPFINQLKLIGMGGTKIQWAKRDYYRAFSQRSKWTREHAVFDGELARFEAQLIEEWQPRFGSMLESHEAAPSDCATLKQAGQDLYYWVETEARFPFRTLQSRSLNVGSYHILANDIRVGWHRDFETLMKKKS